MTTEDYVDSFNIIVSSFGFVLTLFPVYGSMKKSLRPKFKISLYLALVMVFCLYLLLSISAVLYFGETQVRPSIFDNFSAQDDFFSRAIIAIFMLVLLCNIPFAFFAGKIAVQSMVAIAIVLQRHKAELEQGLELTKVGSPALSDRTLKTY